MRRNTPFEPQACPDELLEPYLDGDLDDGARTDLMTHLAECASCTAELERARAVRSALRELPIADCPSGVVDRVLDVARQESAASLRPKVVTLGRNRRWAGRPHALWLTAAAAFLAAIAAVTLLDRGPLTSRSTPVSGPELGQQITTDHVTPEEVARAEQEARLALALFAQLSDRVGDIVQEEVIGRRISRAPSVALEAIREREEKAQ